MRIGGVWVGWGLGDWSRNADGTDHDPTVRRAKAYMRAMFRSYAGTLVDSNKYDEQMASTVYEMQDRLVAQRRLVAGQFIQGVLDLATEYAMGFKKQQTVLPIIFTVEGHMSDMFIGPCAFTAQTLEAQGVCHWKPIGYNNTAMPFDNESGVRELADQLHHDTIEGPPGVLWPFPAGTPFGIMGFSQGGIVHGEFLLRYMLNGSLNWRLPDCKRSLAFGNPYRQKDQIASWVPDPPDHGTQGISDVRLNVAGTAFGAVHREHARHGDLYAENQDSEAGRLKTSVYKAVQGSFIGGGSIIDSMLHLFTQPQAEIAPIIQAVWTGGMFLFNMGPHGMYDLNPCIEWMRGVAH